MALGSRLKEERERQELAQEDLAKLCGSGVSQTTISSTEDRDSRTSKHAARFAAVLGLRLEWLVSGEEPRYITGRPPVAASNVSPGPSIRGSVPLLSWVQAGPFTLADDPVDISDCDQIPTTAAVGSRTFALRVENTSMSPDFPPGTILIVEPDLDARPGDYVIVANGSTEATFKQLVRDGDDWFLRPINPQFPVKPMPTCGRIVGVVVASERRHR